MKTDGIDFEVNYSLDTSFGDIELGLSGSHMNKYEIPNAKGETQDVVGLSIMIILQDLYLKPK